jgi:hypothetical protein
LVRLCPDAPFGVVMSTLPTHVRRLAGKQYIDIVPGHNGFERWRHSAEKSCRKHKVESECKGVVDGGTKACTEIYHVRWDSQDYFNALL